MRTTLEPLHRRRRPVVVVVQLGESVAQARGQLHDDRRVKHQYPCSRHIDRHASGSHGVIASVKRDGSEQGPSPSGRRIATATAAALGMLLAACGSHPTVQRHTLKVASRARPPVAPAAPVPRQLPDVTAKPMVGAETTLRDAGLTVTAVKEPSTAVPAGHVIETVPSARSLVARSSAVRMIVSTGPVRVKLPNLIGEIEAAAVRHLTRAGLVVMVAEQTETGLQVDSVLKQHPSAGTAVTAGSTARITVVVAPVMVTVPNLVGDTEEAAVMTASRLGLVITFASKTVSQSSRAGLVLAQSPLASFHVAKGSQITLTIGRYDTTTRHRSNSSVAPSSSTPSG
jgi:beta-lactam-binding protein with PASTA domain